MNRSRPLLLQKIYSDYSRCLIVESTRERGKLVADIRDKTTSGIPRAGQEMPVRVRRTVFSHSVFGTAAQCPDRLRGHRASLSTAEESLCRQNIFCGLPGLTRRKRPVIPQKLPVLTSMYRRVGPAQFARNPSIGKHCRTRERVSADGSSARDRTKVSVSQADQCCSGHFSSVHRACFHSASTKEKTSDGRKRPSEVSVLPGHRIRRFRDDVSSLNNTSRSKRLQD